MKSEILLQTLIEQTKQIIKEAESLTNNDLQTLTWKENESSWSILETLEHLNLYGDFYLNEIENKIKNSKTTNSVEFKSGFLGNYFAQSMLPKEKLNKMKTFKNKNPLNAVLDKSVLDKFINQQIKLLDLLDQAKKIDLNRIKTAISITQLIKIKLGDTFPFFVNHIIRHLKQIERIKIASKNR